MKKIYLFFFLTSILFINCASVENIGDNRQNPNPEILGELFVERNAGFSMFMPKGWEARDMNQKYLMIIGPTENDFTSNINFADEQYSGPISDFVDAVIGMLAQFYLNFQVLQRGDFATNTGLQGEYITILGQVNEIRVRQRIYVIPNKSGTAVMGITATTTPINGEKFDVIFDESVRTFHWAR
ncbi:MAG: hypothetical protein FWC36_02920 [Spirochaetes bacterium]|nr:hypothetical protein [Spirochaetota bacterium]